MTVEVLAPPMVIVAQTLTIRDGKVTQHSIMACDNPSEAYPARDCKTISQYYSGVGVSTVEELFSDADSCLSRTKVALSRCDTFNIHVFQDFPNTDAMFDMAQTCKADLQSSNYSMLCAVEYDAFYGYPSTISTYIPWANDGFSRITVKDFRLRENSPHKIQ
ncbi:MAG: hypothetical protein ABI690_32870 [Chloroflexota bacterium]